MFTPGEVIQAISTLAEAIPLPLREPSTGRPTYWSKPLLYTKTRPIPVGPAWINYLTIIPGQNYAPVGHAAIINRWVASGLDDLATSGLQYRMLVDDRIIPANEFSLTVGIEQNVDRGSLTPFPAQPQRIFLALENSQRFALQVRNMGPRPTTAIASVTGWFLPNLGNNPREAFEASGLDQDESVGIR